MKWLLYIGGGFLLYKLLTGSAAAATGAGPTADQVNKALSVMGKDYGQLQSGRVYRDSDTGYICAEVVLTSGETKTDCWSTDKDLEADYTR